MFSLGINNHGDEVTTPADTTISDREHGQRKIRVSKLNGKRATNRSPPSITLRKLPNSCIAAEQEQQNEEGEHDQVKPVEPLPINSLGHNVRDGLTDIFSGRISARVEVQHES
jgi:hypothetical protein